MSEKITLEGLLKWQSSAKMEYASFHGRGNNKKLYIKATGIYEVWNHGELICETQHPKLAIQVYEDAKPIF